MNKLLDYLFNLAKGPVSKVVVCTLIGAILFAWSVSHGADTDVTWSLGLAFGAGVGFVASIALVLRDALRPGIVRSVAIVSLLGVVIAALCVAVGYMDRIEKRH